MSEADLANRFTHHPPRGDSDVQFYQDMRLLGHRMADFIAENTVLSREQATALTKIEEAVMWANAARARSGDPFAEELGVEDSRFVTGGDPGDETD